MKEDINNLKKELNEVKEKSFAMEILKDYKKANKRLFIIVIILIGVIGVLTWLLYDTQNDIGSVEDTIEIEDVENIDNSHIKIGDDVWEKLK